MSASFRLIKPILIYLKAPTWGHYNCSLLLTYISAEVNDSIYLHLSCIYENNVHNFSRVKIEVQGTICLYEGKSIWQKDFALPGRKV